MRTQWIDPVEEEILVNICLWHDGGMQDTFGEHILSVIIQTDGSCSMHQPVSAQDFKFQRSCQGQPSSHGPIDTEKKADSHKS